MIRRTNALVTLDGPKARPFSQPGQRPGELGAVRTASGPTGQPFTIAF